MKPRHERAAQFAPFAALRGFEEAVAEKTELKSPRRELSEDEIERISTLLATLCVGDKLRVVYYSIDRYITAEGVLTNLDTIYKTLTLVKTQIRFSDLLDLNRI